MRVRTVLWLLLAVNVLWAAAFVGYVQRASPILVSVPVSALSVPLLTNVPLTITSNTSQTTNAPGSLETSNAHVLLRPNSRQYGWQDVTNEVYGQYLASLR